MEIVACALGPADHRDLAVGLHGRVERLVVQGTDGIDHDPVTATEARIETAIRVVAHGGEVFVPGGAPVDLSRDQELAVLLHRDRAPTGTETAAGVGRDHPIAVERGVERAVAVPADDREVYRIVPVASLYDLSVGLQGNPERYVGVADANVDRSIAGPAAAEGQVQAAVGVETGDREDTIRAPGDVRQPPAAHDDLAVGLHKNGLSPVVAATAEVRGGDAGPRPSKGDVERAVGVVPDEGVVTAPTRPIPRIARENDLAVRLNGNILARVRAAKQVRGHHAIRVEAGVQAAVAVVASDGEVTVAVARHHDLAVRLDRNGASVVRDAAEVGEHDPVTESSTLRSGPPRPSLLAPEQHTLAEILSDEGYATAIISANFAVLSRFLGLQQGFRDAEALPAARVGYSPLLHRVRQRLPAWRVFRPALEWLATPYRPAEEITDSSRAWIRSGPRPGQPYFLLVNYMDAHGPNVPRGRFGDLFAAEPRTSQTSRHGLPAVAQREVVMGQRRMSPGQTQHLASPAQSVDIVPTVLQALGIDAPTPLDGVPLEGRREVMLAEDFPEVWPAGRPSLRHGAGSLALVVDGLKYLRNDDAPEELFDLDRDPLEQRNLAETMPDTVARLRARLEAWSRAAAGRGARPAPPASLPAELEEDLRALGYVE